MYSYFNEYIFSKIVLLYIMRSNYSIDISLKNICNYDINCDSINCYFHQFTPEGEFIWEMLNIKNPIITDKDVNDILLNIRIEQEEIEKDYYVDYLKMSLVIINMIKNNFGSYYPKEQIKHIEKFKKMNYSEDIDLVDDKIKIYFHKYNQIGELSWILLGFDEDMILYSELLNRKNELTNNLLEYDKFNNLKLVKYLNEK